MTDPNRTLVDDHYFTPSGVSSGTFSYCLICSKGEEVHHLVR